MAIQLPFQEVNLVDFVGVIKADPDPPGINRARWIALIQDHPNLMRLEPREGINPFTREPITIYPKPDSAKVVVDGREVGMMETCQSGANEISVWGDAGIVAPLATAIAPLLSGAFEKYEACPHCEQLPAKLKFRHVDASVFMSFHSKLCEDVARGVLRVESGDLQWSDIIECTIRCAHCGTRFQLVCETYHGSGGEWHVEPRA